MEVKSTKIRILLIEDDEDDYLILKEYLKEQTDNLDCKLDWAQSYDEGLQQIQREDHDLYLIDHCLGLYSGLDLLKEAAQAGCQAPMIIVTGLSNREFDQAALVAGATDYLVKDRLDGQLLERSIRYALERNRLLKQIRELAVRDSLTNLYNRRELHRFVEHEMIKSLRYHHPFSVIMLDIDHFKEINDQFGHRTGDGILQQIAQVLLSHIRGCDLPSRFGGDEFIIVLPETSARLACRCAERLRKYVETISIPVIDGTRSPDKIKITISAGVAEYPGDVESGDELIDEADEALYLAKRQGCNQVVNYRAERVSQAAKRGSI